MNQVPFLKGVFIIVGKIGVQITIREGKNNECNLEI